MRMNIEEQQCSCSVTQAVSSLELIYGLMVAILLGDQSEPQCLLFTLEVMEILQNGFWHMLLQRRVVIYSRHLEVAGAFPSLMLNEIRDGRPTTTYERWLYQRVGGCRYDDFPLASTPADLAAPQTSFLQLSINYKHQKLKEFSTRATARQSTCRLFHSTPIQNSPKIGR